MSATAQPKQRPARRQVDEPVTAHEEVHAPGTVNVWTGRVLKEYRKPREERKKEASKYRCLPKVDSGWTRGAASGASYCCLYFARGICHHGADCNYLHRLPTAVDEERHKTDYSHDIFGRERGPAAFDGRKKGVGSYERDCKTLYVFYGGAGTLPTEQVRKIVADNFAEWGPLEQVHLVPAKTIAFVRYQWRSSAEFAKAAMHQQTLRGCDTTEVLDVRWANDDPNPRAVARVQADRESALREAYVKAVNELPPDAKRARIQQLHLAATVRPGVASAAYPDTAGQYGGGSGSGAYKHHYEGWDSYLYQQEQQEQQERPGVGDADEEGEEQDEAAKWAAWQQWQQQQGGRPGGYYPHTSGAAAAADDYTRYLRPEDFYSEEQHWQQAQQQGLAAAAEYERQQQQQQQQRRQWGGGAVQEQQEQPKDNADEVAQEALGLIGGYGSGSDSEEEDQSGNAGGGDGGSGSKPDGGSSGEGGQTG